MLEGYYFYLGFFRLMLGAIGFWIFYLILKNAIKNGINQSVLGEKESSDSAKTTLPQDIVIDIAGKDE